MEEMLAAARMAAASKTQREKDLAITWNLEGTQRQRTMGACLAQRKAARDELATDVSQSGFTLHHEVLDS